MPPRCIFLTSFQLCTVQFFAPHTPQAGGDLGKRFGPGVGNLGKKICPTPQFFAPPPNFLCQKLPKYAIFIRFVMFLGSNMARIVKNSTLKRAAGENFAISCIKTVKNWLIY